MTSNYTSDCTLHPHYREMLDAYRRDDRVGKGALKSYAQCAQRQSRLRRSFDAHRRASESRPVAPEPAVRAVPNVVYLPCPALTASTTPVEPEERGNVIRPAFG
ncbi:MAG: hypothetical protein ACR2O4_09635 [Hyphomicrobiaceae bacterium]